MAALTLYDKLWQRHLVEELPDGSSLLYIDRHLLHEVTSPQAFSGLRAAGENPGVMRPILQCPTMRCPRGNVN